MRAIRQAVDNYPDAVDVPMTSNATMRLRRKLERRDEIIEVTHSKGVTTLRYVGRRTRW